MKFTSHVTHVLALLVCITASANAYANTENDFSEGITSFKSGNYPAAIRYFKKAEHNGLKTAALYYNIGSSYFKSGLYTQSEIYFKKLDQYPKMKSISAYNLGLVNNKLGRKTAADKWFDWVINNSDDKKLVFLASQQTYNTRPATKNKNWSSYAALSLGHDSNINVAPSGTALDLADSFATIFINSNYLLKGDKSDGWLLNGNFYLIDYSKTNTNNESQYSFSLKRNLNISNWESQFSSHLTKSTYNSSAYQTILKLEAKGSRKLSTENTFKIRYSYEDINSDNTLYNYLKGSSQQFRAELKHSTKPYYQRIYYQFENNNRQDSATSSYSPTRHTIKALHAFNLDKNINWGGEISYRQSNYPVIATTDRDSTRWKYGIFGTYMLDKSTRIKARMIHTDNSSNASAYNYTKDMITLALSKTF